MPRDAPLGGGSKEVVAPGPGKGVGVCCKEDRCGLYLFVVRVYLDW